MGQIVDFPPRAGAARDQRAQRMVAAAMDALDALHGLLDALDHVPQGAIMQIPQQSRMRLLRARLVARDAVAKLP